MYINLCGINLAHDKSFIINRPDGSGDNLFIYTRTPIILFDEDGKQHKYPSNTTVFFRKNRPQRFMAAGQIYANDFIHFDATEEDMKFIDSLDIPSGVPFVDLDTSVFMNIHRYICIEYRTDHKTKDEAINHLLKYMLIKLSVAIEEQNSLLINNSVKKAMMELRAEIYAHVDRDYDVATLASRIGFSPSYFQVQYKKLFGRTCINDVMFARIDRAKQLLRTTDCSISEISRSCGFETESHFSHMFKKYAGVTASEYRKQIATSMAF